MRWDDVRVSLDGRFRPDARDGVNEAGLAGQPSPYIFFGLMFLFSTPFWSLGVLNGSEILPGLPISAVMVICPVLAASIFVYRIGGRAALRSFVRRAVDFRDMRAWIWAVALGAMPLVMLISGVIQIAMGDELPPMQIDPVDALVLFGLFFVAATAEELGWSGYATRPLVKAHGIIGAGLVIGAVAALWHLIPLLQVERSWDWIAWWALGTVARRVCIVWMYMRGGQSVFSTSLFHAMSNLTWMLFPVMGSHYDPMVTACVMTGVTVALLAVSSIVNWSRSR